MQVVTWNVLHRIHAENWREAVPDRFPVEAERLAQIGRRIASLLNEADDTVVCLQEVSGDQLRVLRQLDGVDIVAFQYPRVPALRSGGPCPLQAPEEYLVTLAPGAREVGAAAWPADPGKGHLVVDVGGVTVVNTHLSGDKRRGAQLAALAGIAGERVVICGDFNAGLDVVLAGLGDGVVAADLGHDALPTRPRPAAALPSEKPPAIDHILARGLRLDAGAVVDVDGESDHNLVRARLG